MARLHGAAGSGENLSANLNFYTVYLSQLDITATGNILDQTQQNFDDVCNLNYRVGLRGREFTGLRSTLDIKAQNAERCNFRVFSVARKTLDIVVVHYI